MEQRLSLITLGVEDLDRSIAFFDRLGWRRSMQAAQGVAFFQCGGLVLSLYPRADLAADAGVSPEGTGFSGLTISHNVRDRDEVATVLAEAEAAGATIVKPAGDAHWGGHFGYFRDLDGHLWEVAWNPGFPIDSAGNVTVPD